VAEEAVLLVGEATGRKEDRCRIPFPVPAQPTTAERRLHPTFGRGQPRVRRCSLGVHGRFG
jgi:hypothetical protein